MQPIVQQPALVVSKDSPGASAMCIRVPIASAQFITSSTSGRRRLGPVYNT